MAAAMIKFRCERLFCFLRLFNESGRCLSQVFTIRSKFSTSTCDLYCKTLPLLTKKWNDKRSRDHDFAKPPQTFYSREDLRTRSRSKKTDFNRDEEHSKSKPQSDDKEHVNSKSHKLKQKSGQTAKLNLRQKSANTTTLRPSKYLFKDRTDLNEEQRWEGREVPEDVAKKWNPKGSRDHDFVKPQTFYSGDDLGTRPRSKKTDFSNTGAEDPEFDSISKDEENVDSKSHKLKHKSGQAAKLKLRQKSANTTTLRPSKYLFRDRTDWNEEQRWEGREVPEDLKSKASWYARQMLRLTREGEVDNALELLSSMKEEKIPLTVEIFNIMISAYARSGKVRKAFKFYNDVKKRGLQPTPHTYTSLFNACTKSPAPQHTLEHVEKLLAEINTRITRKDLEMNEITYNAAIQAVTVCGDPLRAFEIYKEMHYNNITPDAHTFSSLLAACSFDKLNGPSTAFALVEEMKSLKIKPDIYIFNSVLKVMRDFKVFTQEKKPELPPPVPSSGNTETQTVKRKGKGDLKQAQNEEISKNNSTKQNAAHSPRQDEKNTGKQSDNELKLHSHFPGVEKFIQMMAIEDVYPDVRTFQLLLYMTSSKAEEEYLMSLMKSCNISPDVTFYNTLVKRNALEGDLHKAKEHMKKLEETLKVSPSEKSYQTLARGCTNQEERMALLDEIQSEGITPGQSVYGTLIAGAAKQKQFTSLIHLVKRMTNDGVEPNDRIMAVLERTSMLPCRKPFIEENTHRRLVKEKRFRYVEQRGFQAFFENWKKKILNKETAKKDGEHHDESDDDDDVSDDVSDDEESKFSHL